jgi:Uri superfamily endonuclease
METIKTDRGQGTYALLFKCLLPIDAVVGKIGPIHLSVGYWIYVGSAMGPGGLRARLNHHLRPSRHPRWHLDYIKHGMRPLTIWATSDTVNREHDWSTCLSEMEGASRPIAGFGASDCACHAHLIHLPRQPGFFRFTKRICAHIPTHAPLFRINLDQTS